MARSIVSPANLNSPDQTVISGASAAVQRAADLCKRAGAKRAVMLQVSAPFHCALMQPAQDRLAIDLERLVFNDPSFSVAANVDARLIMRGTDVRDCLIRQVTGAVRWVDCIRLLAAEGATHFIEAGPGKVLTGLNRQILGRDSGIPSLNVEDAASLEKTIAALTS
jgi:[acyl-carrier-protein] S-malonyltransferase